MDLEGPKSQCLQEKTNCLSVDLDIIIIIRIRV